MKSYFFLAVILLFASFEVSAGQLSLSKITKTSISKLKGNYLVIQLDKSVGEQGQESCHSNTAWNFALPLDNPVDDKLFSMVLAAQASGKLVNITGSKSCEAAGNIETMIHIAIES